MRVHVAIVGINRSLRFTYDSIERELLRIRAPKKLVTLSASLTLIRPPDNQIDNPRSGEHGFIENQIPGLPPFMDVLELEQRQIDIAIDSNRIRDLAQSTFAHETPETLVNLFRFLFALKTAFVSEIGPRNPDVIVFARPDVLINGRLWLSLRLIQVWFLRLLTSNVALLPAWGKNRGLNDRFAILSAEAGKDYFTRLDRAEEYFRSNPKSNTEKFLSHVLQGSTVLSNVATPMPRIRVGGIPANRDRPLLETPPKLFWFGIVQARARRLIRILRQKVFRGT